LFLLGIKLWIGRIDKVGRATQLVQCCGGWQLLFLFLLSFILADFGLTFRLGLLCFMFAAFGLLILLFVFSFMPLLDCFFLGFFTLFVAFSWLPMTSGDIDEEEDGDGDGDDGGAPADVRM